MTSAEKGETASRGRRPALRGLWERALEGEGLTGRLVTALLVMVLAVASAFVLVPVRIHPVVPYDDRDLGSFSNGVYKADRDYTIPDEETTQRKREDARTAVRAVYDYDAAAADLTVRRVHEAFGLMQRTYGDYRLELARQAAREAEGDGEPVEAAELRDDPKAVLAAFQAKKAEFLQLLQVVVDDAEFEVLARARFDTQLEKALAELVSEAMRRLVVADMQLLAADRELGIAVRPVPARDTRDERIVSDLDASVQDLVAARAGIGERLAAALAEARPEVRDVVGRLARRLVTPNLTFNREETLSRQTQAAESVKPSVIQVARGERIIGDGERIERRHLVIFRGMREQAEAMDTAEIYVGAGLLGVLVALAFLVFARGDVFRFKPTRKDLLFLLSTLLLTLLVTRVGIVVADLVGDRFTGVRAGVLYYALPVGAAVVMVRLVLSGEVTLVFAAVLSIFAGLLTDHSLGYALYTLVGGLVAANWVGRARDRSGVWRAGLVMGLANLATVVALGLSVARLGVQDLIVGGTAALFAGAVTPLIILGLAYLVEKVFGYTTDLTLLELANLNNSLLKDLVVSAPGTYHHSMMLGAMVESAAEAIGANPILARVGAYYHDIGKGKQPLYFAENQRGENPHDKLNPNMSALIIRRHVTDGIKMGRAAGLPQPIIDMIPMHHGTRLMSYFWHKAKEENEKNGLPAPSETEYRHIGPKPRFREAALLMIADSVEAAARTLTEPNADRFRGVVQKVINNCFADGQFDECDITLKDLHAVTRSFVRSLEAIHHTRPEYQQPADKSKVEALARVRNGDRTATAEVPVPPAPAEAEAPAAAAAGGETRTAAPEPSSGGEKLKRLGTN